MSSQSRSFKLSCITLSGHFIFIPVRNNRSILFTSSRGIVEFGNLSSVSDELPKMPRFSLTFFILCIMNIYASAFVVPFKDCGSTTIEVTKLDFDCEDGKTKPCVFDEGKTYHGNFSITTKAVISNGTIFLHAIIGEATLPFPITDSNICTHHGLTCPIPSGTETVMTVSLKVPSIPVSTNLVAKIEIKSSEKADAEEMCIEFLAKITDDNDVTI